MRWLAAAVLAAFCAGPAHGFVATEVQGTRLPAVSGGERVPEPVAAPGRAGELRVVPAPPPPIRPRTARLFSVAVEGGLPVDVRAFANTVGSVLADPRGWSAAGVTFRRVAKGEHFRVVLASPALTDALCAPLLTRGRFSCATGDAAVLNYERWATGAPAYGDRLRRYRTYVVNHEVGHLLGRGHAWCAAPGAKAPVMAQQTKGVAPCRANPWPLPAELP